LEDQDAVNAARGTGDVAVKRSSGRSLGPPYSYWMVNVAWPFATPAPTVPAWVCT